MHQDSVTLWRTFHRGRVSGCWAARPQQRSSVVQFLPDIRMYSPLANPPSWHNAMSLKQSRHLAPPHKGRPPSALPVTAPSQSLRSQSNALLSSISAEYLLHILQPVSCNIKLTGTTYFKMVWERGRKEKEHELKYTKPYATWQGWKC